MNKNRFFLMLFVATLVGFASCKKEKGDEPKPANENEVEINAQMIWDKWTYFSFEKGEVVGTTAYNETMEGLDWDIAFHMFDVRLNGGKSGKGNAGALVAEAKMGKLGWDDLIVAPNGGYVSDTIIKIMYSMERPPKFADVSGSNIIRNGTWLKRVGTGMPPKYELTNQIFVVKTAKGNFAKIWLKQFNFGLISMKYCYQPDGSVNLN